MKFRAAFCFTASALVLGACASTPPAPAPEARQRQPLPADVAQRLETVRTERERYPDFRDIPITPTDVRTPAQYRQAVQAVKGEAQQIAAFIARTPQEIADAEAYAAQARRELGVGPEDVPPPDQAARIEAFAREARRRAEPPPAIVD